MKNKSVSLCLLFIFLFCVNGFCQEIQWLVKKDYFPKGEIDKDYRAFSDIEISEKEVYIVENVPGHQIQIYEKGNGLLHTGGGPGKNPGELVTPIEFSVWKKEIAVKDNSGLSVFDTKGQFLRILRPFVNIVSFVYIKDKIFILVGTPGQHSLIQAFTPAGEYVKEFGKEFIKLNYSLFKNMSPIMVKGLAYRGTLLSDNKHLYYLSSRFGKAIKFSFNGQKLAEANISEAFGITGEKKIEENTKFWLDNGIDLKETKGRIPSNDLFIDAYLYGSEIYILTRDMVKIQESWVEENNIIVLNKDTFQKDNEYAIRKSDDERILALAVEKKNKEIKFFFTMYQKNEGTRISEYGREK